MADGKVARRKGKKNQKHGRNKRWCEAYRLRGQREKNKARKAERHRRLMAKKAAKKAGASAPADAFRRAA